MQATRPAIASNEAAPNRFQSSLPLKLKRVQHLDDSQASAISEEESEPAVVTSPLSGDWDFEYEDFENLTPGEASVPADHPIGGGDQPEFIPVPVLVENREGIVPEGYWQRRAGKNSVKKVIRQFYMTGRCKWKGRWINTAQELAQAFDQQVINDVKRKLHVHRNWWESNAKVSSKPLPPPKF